MSLPKVEYCPCVHCGGTDIIADVLNSVPVSNTQTPWLIHCDTHGAVFLTNHEYNRQMSMPNALWRCPYCLQRCQWDDDNHELFMNANASPEDSAPQT